MDDPGPTSILSIDYSLVAGFASILLLLFCSAIISGTEVALFSLNPDDLAKINTWTPKKGNLLGILLEKPKKLLATITITNTFLNIAIILFFFRMDCLSAIPNTWLRFSSEVAIITLLILLFGEVLPKVYATRNHVRFSVSIAWPLYVLSKVLSPISTPLREITLWINNKIDVQKTDISVSRLSQALELTDYTATDGEEQKILEGIVTFGTTEARQVMTPRIDIFTLNTKESFEQIMPKIVANGFSRIPVYSENIDAIVGVLFVKDLIPHISETGFAWQNILRNPFYVPENIKLDDLLKEFQGMKNHLAIVVDEHGGTSGIITLEDILEEIVGDITDEFDDEDIFYNQTDPHNYLFDGKIGLKDFYRITDVDEEPFEEAAGEAETLAGFLMEIIGDFPVKGQKINFNGNIFTVESVDKRRIKQIKVTLNETEA